MSSPFPLERWMADMKLAINEICELGTAIVETHRRVSDQAAANADKWRFAERLEDERRALGQLVDNVRGIIESLKKCRELMRDRTVPKDDLYEMFDDSAATIDKNLPRIEEAFITVRRIALDVLQWTQRSGRDDESELPAKYRLSYGRLIRYAPVFRPRMDALQEDLLALDKGAIQPHVQRLISALNRYNAVAESARGFIKSVVEPPFQLVFNDTQGFVDDLQQLSASDQAELATQLNDCCQLLLYDVGEFHRRVEHVRLQLADALESSLAMLPTVGGIRVIFTVDDNPVFEQIEITLLRAVEESDCEVTCKSLMQDLYDRLLE